MAPSHRCQNAIPLKRPFLHQLCIHVASPIPLFIVSFSTVASIISVKATFSFITLRAATCRPPSAKLFPTPLPLEALPLGCWGAPSHKELSSRARVPAASGSRGRGVSRGRQEEEGADAAHGTLTRKVWKCKTQWAVRTMFLQCSAQTSILSG